MNYFIENGIICELEFEKGGKIHELELIIRRQVIITSFLYQKRKETCKILRKMKEINAKICNVILQKNM